MRIRKKATNKFHLIFTFAMPTMVRIFNCVYILIELITFDRG